MKFSGMGPKILPLTLKPGEKEPKKIWADAERLGYVREAQAVGIVHFGIGAFHRAHQAWYTDAAMNAGDRDWGIIGVSLRSGDVAAPLNPQDGLYTVSTRSAAGLSASCSTSSVRADMVCEQVQGVSTTQYAAPARHIGWLRRHTLPTRNPMRPTPCTRPTPCPTA